MAAVVVERACSATDELVDAFARLIPQLSTSCALPTRENLSSIIESKETTVLLARLEGKLVGTLTVAMFRIPTGMRAWIEDVVVDCEARGKGVGESLIKAGVIEAQSRGAESVYLTSRPSREAANRLYQRAGFIERETNVYCYKL
jgi:ribosomal protein S18 acetylase RimI-like enzyme